MCLTTCMCVAEGVRVSGGWESSIPGHGLRAHNSVTVHSRSGFGWRWLGEFLAMPQLLLFIPQQGGINEIMLGTTTWAAFQCRGAHIWRCSIFAL